LIDTFVTLVPDFRFLPSSSASSLSPSSFNSSLRFVKCTRTTSTTLGRSRSE
jgi:hypothetical protein